jgi:hypothetical protein
MQRTNPNADNANMIKLFTPRLCQKSAVYGTVLEDGGDIEIQLEGFVREVALLSGTFTVTSSDGKVVSENFAAEDLFQGAEIEHLGVGPWTVHGIFENVPGNGCACLPEFKVTVGVGGEVEFDQRVDGFAQISGTVSKAVGTEAFAFLGKTNIELDLTSEVIEEGDVYSPNITLTNSGQEPMFVVLQDIFGDQTAKTFANTPTYVVQPGQTLPFGSFTLDTAAAGSKTLEVVFYTNAAPVAFRTLSIIYTVIP